MSAGQPAEDASSKSKTSRARRSRRAEPRGVDRTRWTLETGSAVLGTPAVLGGRVFFADAGGTLRAVEAESGDQLWQAEVDRSAALAAVRDGRQPALFAVGDHEVHALDAGTGDELWSRTLAADDGDDACLTHPCFDGERLYVGCHGAGVLRALDPATGETLDASEPLGEWPSLEPSAVRGGPADGVYVGARDPEAGDALLYRLERPGLETAWRARLPAEEEGGTGPCPASAPVPLPERGEVCWTAADGRLVVLPAGGPETGGDGPAEPVCSTRLRNTADRCLLPAPAVGADGLVYAAADGAGSDFDLSAPCLYALDPEGDATIRWFEHLDGSPYRATPVVAASGAVLLREETGRVRAVREVSGRVRNQMLGRTPTGAGGSMTLADDGTLFVGGEEGWLAALDASAVAGGGLADAPWPTDRADARNTACVEG